MVGRSRAEVTEYPSGERQDDRAGGERQDDRVGGILWGHGEQHRRAAGFLSVRDCTDRLCSTGLQWAPAQAPVMNETHRNGETNGVAEPGDSVRVPKTVCGRIGAIDPGAAVENACAVPNPYAAYPGCGEYCPGGFSAIGVVVDPVVGVGDTLVGVGDAPASTCKSRSVIRTCAYQPYVCACHVRRKC